MKELKFFEKNEFLKLGFVFEKLTPDDPNPDYYGWMILNHIKFYWADPCFKHGIQCFEIENIRLWGWGYVGNQKTDFSNLYFLDSVEEIKKELETYAGTCSNY